MILDNNLLVSGSYSAAGVLTGQTVTGTNTSVVSTNSVDLAPLALGGNQAADLGQGEKFALEVSVITAPTVGTSVKFQIIVADDAALTTNVEVVNSSDDIPIANLPAGTIVPVGMDRLAPLPAKRYLGARYVLVGAIATQVLSAAFVKDIADVKNILFKSGFAVL
jgi:hypothetical protein